MGEIDDNYNSEVELLDSDFLEELKISKNPNKSFEKYRSNLKKLKAKFYSDYDKFNTNEKRRLLKLKKKIEKNPEFKHLEIKHFEFEFGFWERSFMRLDVLWFNFVRIFRRLFSWMIPGWVIYYWVKFRRASSSNWGDFSTMVFLFWAGIEKFFISEAVFVWEEAKKVWIWSKKVFSKISFWNKKGAEDVKEGTEGEEKKNEKESETN